MGEEPMTSSRTRTTHTTLQMSTQNTAETTPHSTAETAAPTTQAVTPPTPAPSNSTIRPGISNAMLQQAGICHIDAKTAFSRTCKPYSGLWIPYRNLDGTDMVHAGKPFGRIRMDVPNDKQKYHQEFGSPVRAYLPPNLKGFPKHAPLYLIEGEFKALALAEAGFCAVGLGGIYGFGRDKSTVLLEEIKGVLNHFTPEQVHFVGDSDMCTNFQFSDAAIKLHKLINN
jgi:hypothetical protein